MENSVVERTSSHHTLVTELASHLKQRIIGQEHLVNTLLVALLSDGHLLVEGAPGLAKTTAIKELSACIEGDFHRIQFTPDLLPADLTGTEIFRQQDGSFVFQQGPLFHNVLLADEINRAPAKVQSALLEAMAERQITIGRTTYDLPPLYLVMATQNPIEQEGTYPLPEAQLDRFLLYVRIDYPETSAEKQILALNRAETKQATQHTPKSVPKITQEQIFAIRGEILDLHLSPALEEYLVQLVMATRHPSAYGDDLAKWLRYGASPRGTIGLDRASRAYAWLQGRDYVSPEDIHAVAHDVLRHRILLTFEAEAQGITPNHVLDEIIRRVAVP
ncbi:MAG: AAA family ATPase [Legionellales bacterium]|nr:AAA family ATPase [Legionellales bacterium]|tara:strand:+ start:4890 stop:5885 length:996 start_codon:yes stop_codon:yes gene_type:complete